jgi:hypothetical protein
MPNKRKSELWVAPQFSIIKSELWVAPQFSIIRSRTVIASAITAVAGCH